MYKSASLLCGRFVSIKYKLTCWIQVLPFGFVGVGVGVVEGFGVVLLGVGTLKESKIDSLLKLIIQHRQKLSHHLLHFVFKRVCLENQ